MRRPKEPAPEKKKLREDFMNSKKRWILYGGLTLMAAARQLDAADGARANGGPQISGDYRVVITQTCLRTPYQTPPATGFDPKTGQLMLDADAFTAIGSGLVQFAGDGSVQITEGTQTEVSVKQTAQGM